MVMALALVVIGLVAAATLAMRRAPVWYSAQARCHGLRRSNTVCVPALTVTGISSSGAERVTSPSPPR